MTKKKSPRERLHEFYAAQRGQTPHTEAKIFEDKYGIKCAECSRCNCFLPNVEVKQVIICPVCHFQITIVE